MASATAVTKRNIVEREERIRSLRVRARTLGPGQKTLRREIAGEIKKLLLEVAALKASLHYYKAPDELRADIARQQAKVGSLTKLFKGASGPQKHQVGKQLRKEAKKLNEMLAAAKVQQLQAGSAELGSLDKMGFEGDAVEVEESGTADILEFDPSGMAEDATEIIAKLDESWDKLDEYTDEEGEVWYKNPIVLIGAGVAAWLVLRRS